MEPQYNPADRLQVEIQEGIRVETQEGTQEEIRVEIRVGTREAPQ